ncbi:Os03g0121250, partial [Oryza sativa Japonica Group]
VDRSAGHPAVCPDGAGVAGEHADGAHLDHGGGEVGLERVRVVGVADDLRGGGLVGEERLVGAEQSPVSDNGGVVVGVKGVGRDGVHGHHPRRGLPLLLRALRRQRGDVAGVHAGVLPGVGARRVEAVAEGAAVRHADGVRARQCHHFRLGEPLGAEHLVQLRHVRRRRRQVPVRLLRHRHVAVSPPPRHLKTYVPARGRPGRRRRGRRRRRRRRSRPSRGGTWRCR